VHRDIKLDNIVLVNRAETTGDINSLDIRIIDFGLAMVLPTKRVKDREKVGTYTHMAPEVINGVYSTKCDLWSSGIVLYSMIAGCNPFKKVTRERTFESILKGELEFLGKPHLKQVRSGGRPTSTSKILFLNC
jgi:calcium-dependent protein kinase